MLAGSILDTGVLDEEGGIVGALAGDRVLSQSACALLRVRVVKRSSSEVEVALVFADGRVELVGDKGGVGLASLVGGVVLADVLVLHLLVHAVVEDLADVAVGAGQGKTTHGSRDLGALDAGVTEVTEVSVEVVALDDDIVVSATIAEEHHSGQQQDRVQQEGVDESPKHVDVGHDTEAELGNGVSLLSLGADGLLLLGGSLHDLLSVDRDSLGFSVGSNILCIGDKVSGSGGIFFFAVAGGFSVPREGLAIGGLLEGVELFEQLVCVLDLVFGQRWQHLLVALVGGRLVIVTHSFF